VTTAPPPPAVAWRAPYPGGWARDFRFGEWLGDPLTPLFEACLLPVLERAFWAALRREAGMPTPRPTYAVVDGWYYASLNFWPPHALGTVARLARRPRLLRVLLQLAPPRGVGPRAVGPRVADGGSAAPPHVRAGGGVQRQTSRRRHASPPLQAAAGGCRRTAPPRK
jgi:hypothetical protein